MEIGISSAELVLDKLRNIKNWMLQGNCAQEDVDPFLESDYGRMQELCSTCKVFQECQDEFIQLNQKRRIEFGVFHGVNYEEEKDQ